jgi:hypothetical protein
MKPAFLPLGDMLTNLGVTLIGNGTTGTWVDFSSYSES